MKYFIAILLLVSVFPGFTQNSLNVGVIEMQYAHIDDMAQTIIDQANELINDHPDVDVIVTPEYSLFSSTGYDQVYISLDKSGDIYELNPTEGDQKTINHLKALLELAKDNGVQLILGTVPLKLGIDQSIYSNLNGTGVFNATLIINEKGEITDYDLKVRGSDWLVGKSYPEFDFIPAGEINSYSKGYPIFEDGGVYLVADTTHLAVKDAVKFTNQTTKVRAIKSKSGAEFKYATLICAERHSFEMLDMFKGEKVDIVFYQEWEGYYYFDELMETIQNGVDTADFIIGNNSIPIDVPYAFKSFKRDLYKEFKKRDMIDEETYLIASDSKKGRAGVLKYDFKKVAAIDYSKEYVYAKIPANPGVNTSATKTDGPKHTLSVTAFPNPVSKQLNISSGIHAEQLKGYTISDISGRIVAERVGVDPCKFSIDVSKYKPGMYILRVLGKEGNTNMLKFYKK